MGSELRVAEGRASVWTYHLSNDAKSLVALCGALTMATGIPLSAWGKKGHLPERWCKECERTQPAPKGGEER